MNEEWIETVRLAVSSTVLNMCAQNSMMPLGELAARLESMPPDAAIRLDLANMDTDLYPGHLDSYRGHYEHVAIRPSNDPIKVADLLWRVRDAIGDEFEGYKGGCYTMTRFTPVWVSPYGESSGLGLVKVELVDSEVVLRTAETEEY